MYQIDFNHPIRVFFVGIGGISMSGLARILASEGFTVSGRIYDVRGIDRCRFRCGFCCRFRCGF